MFGRRVSRWGGDLVQFGSRPAPASWLKDEPATSWFVVVTPVIYQVRPMTMKILRLIDLPATVAPASTMVDHRRSSYFNRVASHFTSQLYS